MKLRCPVCNSEEITPAVFQECYGEIDKTDNPMIFNELVIYIPYHGSDFRCKKCNCYFSIWWREDKELRPSELLKK